jgi:hypothetical protein
VNDEASSDEEMMNNKFFSDTSLGASDFHSRLLADNASRRKLKAREAFTVPFLFYAIMLINQISTCLL